LRLFPLNGLGVYATWLSLAANLSFAQFLSYNVSVQDNIGATIALVNIFIILVFYFVFENFIWQRFLLYMFTPYLVVDFVFVGILVMNWRSGHPTRNNIIALIVLIVAGVFTIGKAVMFALYKTVWKNKLDSSLLFVKSAKKELEKLNKF
jgi:uncharacterized membrane protein